MEKFTKYLEKKGFHVLEKLKGDASTRDFYRVKRKRETFVIMRFNSPGIEEQIRVYRLLGSVLPLSRILDVFLPVNALLMEDAGDLSLEKYMKEGKGPWRSIYKDLLGMIEVLQTYTGKLIPEEHPVRKRKLDRERFKKELDFTFEHFILPFGIDLQREKWGGVTEKLLNLIDFSFVVCHRDFHSRNIYIKNGRLIILDYQDSMLGPVAYDYASLLRDNYIYFTEEERKNFEDEIFQKTTMIQYEAVSLQRHLKALGTFGYQSRFAGKKHFELYIPITLKYIKEEYRKIGIPEIEKIMGNFHL